MKALTICQPYPELILRNAKRVENRTWYTDYRGPLLIHAGKSKKWMDVGTVNGRDFDFSYGIPVDQMTFGAIVGQCVLSDCLEAESIRAGDYEHKYPGIRDHEHVSGPWCFVVCEIKRWKQPIAYRGSLGFFDVPDDVIKAAA